MKGAAVLVVMPGFAVKLLVEGAGIDAVNGTVVLAVKSSSAVCMLVEGCDIDEMNEVVEFNVVKLSFAGIRSREACLSI